MATIITAVGQKGGGGKSTAVISLAVEYARRGARVLIGDADPQGTCLTWAAVASESESPNMPTVVGLHEGFHRNGQLPLESFDVVLIDTPARLTKVSRAALMLADLAVVPVSAGGIESWALSSTLEVIEEAQAMRELKAFLLINRQQRTGIAKTTRSALEDSGLPIFATQFGFRVAYQESITAGRGPTTWEPDGKAATEVEQLANEITEILSHAQAANA